MVMNGGIYVSELSASRHVFNKFHFCRGNSNRRKSRLGIILKGRGTYIYLGKRLKVSEGDVVFIPESIYCYSEWRGDPQIEVVYLSCFIHYERFKYEPQTLELDNPLKNDILQIAELLSKGELDILEAYSRYYRLLQTVLPSLRQSEITVDKTLQTAIEFITDNIEKSFSISELAKKCCVSQSTLYHLFQREMGQSPVSFLNSVRINIAIEQLENTDHSVSTISRAVGFNSENHFRKVFSSLTGTTPMRYRKGR
ncbi:MAG: helix-turn-helix domain-containing protein [Ruminococcaceae bacterium]|nr:helix-turn-helix domain-containing protein [Oscillospiraceae bacterium]